jgi:hypothetical protein
MNHMRIVLAMAVGILVAFLVGSVIGTQMVLRSVEEMGLAVSWGMRLSSSWNDIVGLSASLLPLMAIALAPAWLLLAWLDRRSMLTINAGIGAMCGALCAGLLHTILNMVFGVDVFAPARTWLGVLCQAAAGALGGWAMASLCGSSEDVASNR